MKRLQPTTVDPWMILDDGISRARVQDRNELNLFSELQLSPAMQRQLAYSNFVHPTPVQAAALPPAL
jgi:superfamily II DNA/RNA helicase